MITFPTLPDNEAQKLKTVDDLVELGFPREMALEAVDAVLPMLEVIKDEVHELCSSSDIAKHLQLCLLVNGLHHQSREAFLWTQLTLPLLAQFLRELEPTQPPEKGIVI